MCEYYQEKQIDIKLVIVRSEFTCYQIRSTGHFSCKQWPNVIEEKDADSCLAEWVYYLINMIIAFLDVDNWIVGLGYYLVYKKFDKTMVLLSGTGLTGLVGLCVKKLILFLYKV